MEIGSPSASSINNIDHLELEEEFGFFKENFLSNKDIIKKIKNTELDLKDGQDIEKSPISYLRNIINRENIIYYGKFLAEYPIEISTADGEICLPIIDNLRIFEKLEKINEKHRKKIGYIHISTIQILIKSTFMEGINSPIRLSVCDDRIQDPKDRIIGIVNGNLSATKIKFNISLQLGIPLCTERLNKSIVLAYKFLRKDLMQKDDYPFTLTYAVGYALTNSHHSIHFRNKDKIYMDQLFQTTAKIGTIKRSPIDPIPRIDNRLIREQVFSRPSMRLVRNATTREPLVFVNREEDSKEEIKNELLKLNESILSIESHLKNTL